MREREIEIWIFITGSPGREAVFVLYVFSFILSYSFHTHHIQFSHEKQERRKKKSAKNQIGTKRDREIFWEGLFCAHANNNIDNLSHLNSNVTSKTMQFGQKERKIDR